MEALLVLIGMIIGGAVGGYVGLLRGRGEASAEVPSLNARLEEIRSQLTDRDAELTELRASLESERVARAEDAARLDAAREHFKEQRTQITEMQAKVKETFSALSAEALKSSNQQFLTLADEKLKPLREQLLRYEKQIAELEKARSEAYGGLNRRLQRMDEGHEKLSHETQQLVAALRQPGAKGEWGEVGLRNLLEMTGMSEYCDFQEQVVVRDEEGTQRPDVVLRLPGGGSLVIDAKFNASAYLDAMQASDKEERDRHLARFGTTVRNTVKSLGAKTYWKQFEKTPEFVVMFIPGEAFYAAAISQDPDLIQTGMASGVLPACPTTLAALLMAIRHGWREQHVTENAERIAIAGRALYERLTVFVGHLEGVRGGLEKAAEAYNKAIGNWETRTLPGVRKLKDLGAEGSKSMPKLKRADLNTRAVPPQPETPAESETGLF